MRLPSVPNLVSLRFLIALVVLLALQAFPIPGVILMMFLAPIVTGILVHGVLVGLVVDAIRGRVPRAMIVVPIVAYGCYYALYIHEGIEAAKKSTELRAANPGKIFDFEPTKHSLVMADAGPLVSHYAIPVAYEAATHSKEGYHSYRLIRRDQCDIPRDSQARIQTFGVHFGSRFLQNVCLLRFPEKPPRTVVTVSTRNEKDVQQRHWAINERVTEIAVDGKVIGTFRTASIGRLLIVPALVLGCGLNSSSPAWECGAALIRWPQNIGAVPDRIDQASFDSPVSVMLGLKRYTASALAEFHGFEENADALAEVARTPQRVEDAVFETLEAIVAGQNPKPPVNMGYSIAQNPRRLAPLGDAMAKRFVALNQGEGVYARHREDQVRALEAGLAALPRDVFLSVSDLVFAVVQQDRAAERHPVLYVRTGDVGIRTLEFYRNELLVTKRGGPHRMLPVLAICRIGQADEEVISEMKRRLSSINASEDPEYVSALFVALLRLGEESFLRKSVHAMPQRLRDWSSVLLGGVGVTETGPNNCMAMSGGLGSRGPEVEPALQLIGGTWNVPAPKLERR